MCINQSNAFHEVQFCFETSMLTKTRLKEANSNGRI
uniref:Uncharacterized protein n=1 Tax=Anguilla anguilla TaxID=7936 RepID=A0A0E9VFU4_ANGAN